MDTGFKQHAKIALALLASFYFFYYASSRSDWHFIDSVNLIFHEAGHVIFMPFGSFLHALGGSLTQILIPLLCSLYFFFQGQNFSGSLVLFWVGQNLINVSVYVSDAIKMQLPLLGGDNVIHDWNYLLIYIGKLRYAEEIGTTFFVLGILVLLLAAILSLRYCFRDEESNNNFGY